MPQYLSPGVYVQEVPSAVQPIAGVGTSTAGFIGAFEGQYVIDEKVGDADNEKKEFPLKHTPLKDKSKWAVKVGDAIYTGKVGTETDSVVLKDKKVIFTKAPPSGEDLGIVLREGVVGIFRDHLSSEKGGTKGRESGSNNLCLTKFSGPRGQRISE